MSYIKRFPRKLGREVCSKEAMASLHKRFEKILKTHLNHLNIVRDFNKQKRVTAKCVRQVFLKSTDEDLKKRRNIFKLTKQPQVKGQTKVQQEIRALSTFDGLLTPRSTFKRLVKANIHTTVTRVAMDYVQEVCEKQLLSELQSEKQPE
jgi:hypothetical protein